MLIHEYGHFSAKGTDSNGEKYELHFKPTLSNISKIGTPKEIIQAIDLLYGYENKKLLDTLDARGVQLIQDISLSTAIKFLQVCCEDDIRALTGYYKEPENPERGHYIDFVDGYETPLAVLELAKHCVIHGIIGKSKSKRNRRSTNAGRQAEEFSAQELADLARVHLELSREEAWSMTVTELLMLINAKAPPEDRPSDEEMEAFRAQCKAIDDKIKARAKKDK